MLLGKVYERPAAVRIMAVQDKKAIVGGVIQKCRGLRGKILLKPQPTQLLIGPSVGRDRYTASMFKHEKDQVSNGLPSIAGIVFSPAEISPLALEDDGRMKCGAIGTNTFDNCYEVAITGVDFLNGFLVAVDKDLDLVADAELDAL